MSRTGNPIAQQVQNRRGPIETTGDAKPMPDTTDTVPRSALAQIFATQLKKSLADPALMEVLAAIEHERWASWERYRATQDHNPKNRERWATQRVTEYAELDDKHKASDRVEVQKTLSAIADFFEKDAGS